LADGRRVSRASVLAFRFALFVGLIAACVCPATADDHCVYETIWDTSGWAGFPNESPHMPLESAPGVPKCEFTLFPESNWYGHCWVKGWVCDKDRKHLTPQPIINGTPQYLGCGAAVSSPTCGQPISLATGNTYIVQTDITMPGLGGLLLTRTWNSLWPSTQTAYVSGAFGTNWRSNYEERVYADTDGTVEYLRGDGSTWSFVLSVVGGQSSYELVAPSRQYATLALTPEGWAINFKNGEKRLFSMASGSLIAIVDRNANTTQLSYDSLNRLSRVTDPASRHIDFGYESPDSQRVATVTSVFGVHHYSYDGHGRLIKVTNPDGTWVSFEHDPRWDDNSLVPALITSVKDADNKILETHTYDTCGRGLTSARANGVESVSVSYPVAQTCRGWWLPIYNPRTTE
jgi:YD repeat-containing protein